MPCSTCIGYLRLNLDTLSMRLHEICYFVDDALKIMRMHHRAHCIDFKNTHLKTRCISFSFQKHQTKWLHQIQRGLSVHAYMHAVENRHTIKPRSLRHRFGV
jgi:hypothetical protein